MNILIIGVNGFIGRALWNYLKERKFPLKVFGTHIKLENPILDLPDLKKILNRIRPDVIFHLAGGKPADENALWQANFLSTKILLDAVIGTGSFSPLIVVPGSAAEYGDLKTDRPVSERSEPRPLWWYGFVKYMQTNLGLMYARNGMDVRIARIFNVGGYGTPETLALGSFAQRIVRIERGETPAVLNVGLLSGRRDFVDIEDVCAALWAIARRGKKGETYNVCSGRAVNMRDLLRKMISLSAVRIIVKEEQTAHSPSFDIVGSSAKLRRATGWRPQVTAEQSLRNTLRYYREL